MILDEIFGQNFRPRSDINCAFPSQGSLERGVTHPSLACSNIGYREDGSDLKPEYGGVPQQVVFTITSVRQEHSGLPYATASLTS